MEGPGAVVDEVDLLVVEQALVSDLAQAVGLVDAVDADAA